MRTSMVVWVVFVQACATPRAGEGALDSADAGDAGVSVDAGVVDAGPPPECASLAGVYDCFAASSSNPAMIMTITEAPRADGGGLRYRFQYVEKDAGPLSDVILEASAMGVLNRIGWGVCRGDSVYVSGSATDLSRAARNWVDDAGTYRNQEGTAPPYVCNGVSRGP